MIDKDLATSLLAQELDADLFVMATDVDGVYADWGTPDQRRLDRVTTDELRAMAFPAGSMGPKVDGRDRVRRRHGKRAAIGSLEQHRSDGGRNRRHERRGRRPMRGVSAR